MGIRNNFGTHRPSRYQLTMSTEVPLYILGNCKGKKRAFQNERCFSGLRQVLRQYPLTYNANHSRGDLSTQLVNHTWLLTRLPVCSLCLLLSLLFCLGGSRDIHFRNIKVLLHLEREGVRTPLHHSS